jgi:hypothetical protein
MPNGTTPLPITITDQQVRPSEDTVDRIGEAASDLKHEGVIRMRRAADNLDSTRVQFDHEQRVIGNQPTARPHFGREEIRCHQRRPMRLKERLP